MMDLFFSGLITPRLNLRRFRPGDAPAFFACRSDPRVARYQYWRPKSLQEVEDFIRKLSRVHPDTPDTWFQLAICLQNSDELIGDCGLHFPARPDYQVEVGFTLCPSYQGRGYATEAVRAVIDYIFHNLRKQRVVASVDPENTRSIALVERIGLRREGHFRKSLRRQDGWADELIYALLAEEWDS